MSEKKKRTNIISWVIFWVYVVVAVYLDIEKAGTAEGIQKPVHLENLGGITLFFANLYNNDRLMFAVVSLLSMAAIGIILAYVTELILKLFGFEVTKIKHVE